MKPEERQGRKALTAKNAADAKLVFTEGNRVNKDRKLPARGEASAFGLCFPSVLRLLTTGY
jgi:hypothetical protein